MNITQVPAGCKLTDLGVLPEDWEVKQIGELVKFEGGSQPVKSTFSVAQKPGYIRLIQIRDYKTDDFAIYIPAELARKTCTKDDVMIGRYGPPVFQILGGIEGAYNVALIKSVPNEKISKAYWRLTVSQETLFHFIDGLSRRSSGQTGVDMVELKKYLIALPPPAEQQAIAAALGEMNSLLAAQRARLAKQRAVKQGLLQGLLSGKQRLPGFAGEWKELSIKKDFTLHARIGWQGLATNEYLDEGPYYLVTGTDFVKNKITWQTCHFVEKYRYDQDAKIKLRVGDLLVTKDGTIGKIAYVDQLSKPATLNSGVFVLRPKSASHWPLFIFYVFQSEIFTNFIDQLTAGSTIADSRTM